MATTNNVQGDELLRSTALERQVQTLMAAVERLTKQNHDLEEQLRQRDAGHNVQEENQEGTSAERREQERPEGSNALSRPERQNMSLPSLMETAPPPIVAEMQAMKEQMEVMMNALKGRVSNDRDDLIKDEGALTFPRKLKGDPSKRPRDKYCHFHRDHGHDTANCYDLKQQIKALIRQGKLQRFVNKERTDLPQEQAPRRENEHPRPPIGDIRMIVRGTIVAGSSKKAHKTYLRMVHSIQLTGFVPKMPQINNPIIRFSEDDARRLHHPHDDALVVSLQIGDYNMHRVFVDNGSSADILYYPAFQQMNIDRELLTPTNALLVGFGGTKVFPLGAITLSVTAGDYPQQITREVTFLVVDCSFAYNAILR
ncbi:uncharacterized protein LOC126697746 [Quercus robur]|uniref:uncharacterized protein LOC126697746 n=1 Tax=Quercus robur TaxID=38942 RepID=UPI002162063D|nr:uncharacterized protein LOC126697746 [Quercus robur]